MTGDFPADGQEVVVVTTQDLGDRLSKSEGETSVWPVRRWHGRTAPRIGHDLKSDDYNCPVVPIKNDQ